METANLIRDWLFITLLTVLTWSTTGIYLLNKDYLFPTECDTVEVEKHTEVNKEVLF